MTYAIEADSLEKTFGGTVRALDGVSFEVAPRHRARPARTERGRQDHHGAHPHHPRSCPTRAGRGARASTYAQATAAIRSHIGLAGQYAAVDENLTGRENIELVGRLNHLPQARAQAPGHGSCSSGSA